MKHVFVIPIGDASEDGHGHCIRFYVESSISLEELSKAYEDSCKLTGLQMNTNTNYTGLELDWNQLSKRRMCNEYGDNELSEFHIEVLTEHGIKPDFLNIGSAEDFLDFFFQFIRLTVKDWEVKVIPAEKEPEFGHNIGYGMFEDY